MSFLPPATLPPYIPHKAPSAMVSHSPAFLPPVAVSSQPPRNTVELTPTAPTEKKKGGRPTKADKLKEARKHASDAIAELLEDKPTKKDIYRYFETRIEELRT
jgi:hypothetical protein